MSPLNNLNKIDQYLDRGVPFLLEQNGDEVQVRRQTTSDFIEIGLETGDAAVDAEIGGYIITQLFNSSASPEVRETALKTAKHFEKARIQSYSSLTRPDELTQISKQISEFEQLMKVSQKLNIPINLLLEDKNLADFIVKNHLHNRIDKTYVERNYGPRVENDKVYFPLNTGSSLNDQEVQWVTYDRIPTDKKGKITYTYGPFGFEPYDGVNAREFRPIKLQPRPDGVAPTIRIELVTKKPTYDLTRLGNGSFGHGWIRIYQPQINENGEDTGKDFVYSIGLFIEKFSRGNLISPDLTEFVPGTKLITTQETISPEKFQELKTFIQNLQAAFRGEDINDTEAVQTVKRLNGGTCCNFSTDIYRRGTGRNLDGRLWIMRQARVVTQPIGAAMKHLVPGFITRWGSLLQNGFFPGTLIGEQEACTIS